jgi:hypothetical protein
MDMVKRSLQTSVILLLFTSLFFATTVFARDSLKPQKVTAVIEGEYPAGMWNSACPPNPVKMTVEVWNVGSKGGSEYATASLLYESQKCSVNDGAATLVQNDPATFTGTFSGGPDGVFSFDDPQLSEWKVLFVNGSSAQAVIAIGEQSYVFEGKVQNPEAFDEITPTPIEMTPSLTPVSECTPVIGNLKGLKPGDTLSPHVLYFDADGKNVGALSSVLYFNGLQANSITWDGRVTRIILQYTCPDHSAHQTEVVLPAYQGATGGNSSNPPDQVTPASPVNSNQGSSSGSGGGLLKTLGTVGGIITGLVGAAGAVASGGYVAAKMTTKAAPAAVKSAPVKQAPARPVIESIPTPPELQKPIYKKLTPTEKIDLQKRRKMMEDQVKEDAVKYNALVAARQKLLYVYKKNGFKYVLKVGLDQATKITFGVPEYVAGKIMDPILDAIFQKDDFAKDGKTLKRMSAALNDLDSQAKEVMEDIEYLGNEINKISLQLANG